MHQVRVENVFIRSKCNEGCSWCIYVIVVTCADSMIHWCRKRGGGGGGGGVHGGHVPPNYVSVCPPTFWHLPTPLIYEILYIFADVVFKQPSLY